MATYEDYQPTKPSIVRIEYETISTTVADTTTEMSFFKIDGLQKFQFIDGAVVNITNIEDVVDTAPEYGAGTYAIGDVVQVGAAKLKFMCAAATTIATEDVEAYHPMNESSELSIWEPMGTIDEYAPRDKDPESSLVLDNTHGLIVKVVQEAFNVTSAVSAEGVFLPTAIALSGVNAYRAMVVKVVSGVVADTFELDMTNRSKIYIQAEVPTWGTPSPEWYVWLFPTLIPNSAIIGNTFIPYDLITTTNTSMFAQVAASFDERIVVANKDGHSSQVWKRDDINGGYDLLPALEVTGLMGDLAVSTDGAICAYVIKPDTAITQVKVNTVDPSTGQFSSIFSLSEQGAKAYRSVAISPDAQQIAVVCEDFDQTPSGCFVRVYSSAGTFLYERLIEGRAKGISYITNDYIAVGFFIETVYGVSSAGRVYILDALTLNTIDSVVKTAPKYNDWFGVRLSADHTDRTLFVSELDSKILHTYQMDANGYPTYTGAFVLPAGYTGRSVSQNAYGQQKIWTCETSGPNPDIQSFVRSSAFSSFVPDIGTTYSSWLSFFDTFYGIPVNSLWETRNTRLGLVATGRAREIEGCTEFGLRVETIPSRQSVERFGVTTLETVDMYEEFTANIILENAANYVAAKYILDTSLVNDVIIHPAAPSIWGENWIVGKISGSMPINEPNVNRLEARGTSLPQELVDRQVPRKVITKGWY